jgi:hypothetical protein
MADSFGTIDTEASANTSARDQTSDDALLSTGIIRAVFDATGGQVQATVPIGPTLPDNCVITQAWYYVVTTFTSATGPDNAQISLGVATDDAAGLVALVAINVGTPWDAGWHDCIQDGAAANVSTQTTSATRTLEAVVAVDDLTAGKLIVYAKYTVTE